AARPRGGAVVGDLQLRSQAGGRRAVPGGGAAVGERRGSGERQERNRDPRRGRRRSGQAPPGPLSGLVRHALVEHVLPSFLLVAPGAMRGVRAGFEGFLRRKEKAGRWAPSRRSDAVLERGGVGVGGRRMFREHKNNMNPAADSARCGYGVVFGGGRLRCFPPGRAAAGQRAKSSRVSSGRRSRRGGAEASRRSHGLPHAPRPGGTSTSRAAATPGTRSGSASAWETERLNGMGGTV